jgi:hypothetical protein
VVFGRNHAARDEMYTFVGALGLRPIEFDDAVRATNEGTPTIDRILDAAFSLAQAVIILLTGDDEARLLPAYQQAGDPAHEKQLTPQPRRNAIRSRNGLWSKSQPKHSRAVWRLVSFSDISAVHDSFHRSTKTAWPRSAKDRGCIEDSAHTGAAALRQAPAQPGEAQAR